MSQAQFDTSQPSFESLRSLVGSRTNKIVLLLGAGLSKPAGFPLWRDLKETLIKQAETNIRGFEAEERERVMALAKAAAFTKDLWQSFELLREALGQTSFRSAIKKAFSDSDTCPIPGTYQQLGLLRPSAVMTLNLDRLVQRTFIGSMSPIPAIFTGQETGEYTHLLTTNTPFIAQLHGNLDNDSSWVLTTKDFARLRESEQYTNFFRVCLAARTLLMVGVSADDVAVGGFIADVVEKGIVTGEHYWITDRVDGGARKWAENANVRIVTYDASREDHSQLLECLRHLVSYIPPEELAPPVAPSWNPVPHTAYDATSIAEVRDENELRRILNSMAASLLGEIREGRRAAEDYDRFCREFDAAIYRAWYVSTQEGGNQFFEYKLADHIADGGFGTVYKAIGPGSTACAVKILRGEVRKSKAMLESFRRGVQAMRILSEAGVKGMVSYHQASEIPASAVMDYVEGMNLKQAVDAQLVTEWSDVLWIACELVSIIRTAHKLPQRVLHRDLRPENVMIRNPYADRVDQEIVVLDFDLCWHRDAEGMSVQTQNDTNGFVAPELLRKDSRTSTRSAAVDAFGLGMTLYFLRVGVSPRPAQHRYANWMSSLDEAIARRPSRRWESLSRRFARLIYRSTLEQQSERMDVSSMAVELQALQAAELKPEEVESAELLAEEIAARSDLFAQYRWDADSLTAISTLPYDVRIVLRGSESDRRVYFELRWQSAGAEDRSGIAKYIAARTDQALSKLRKAGWVVHLETKSTRRVAIDASVHFAMVRSNLDASARIVDDVATCFIFD